MCEIEWREKAFCLEELGVLQNPDPSYVNFFQIVFKALFALWWTESDIDTGKYNIWIFSTK